MLIWLVGAVGDRIWFASDRSVPAWDQAEYLTSSLNYWQALQQPQWLNSTWWTNFWQLSTKVPPLTQIATGIVQQIFGTDPDQATLINLFFSAILLAAVYGLGVQLFSAEVGLWAAGLCQLLPGLYRIRLDFLLDYPLAAAVTLSFWCLTVWRIEVKRQETRGEINSSFIIHHSSFQGWLWTVAFGISLGLALLVKQTALFFLLTPVLWAGVEVIRRRNWQKVFQLVVGLLLSVAVFGPWYRTNWLLILSGGKRATVDSAAAEGDPALNTLAAWTYYWKELPEQVSWLFLLVAIAGLLFYLIRQRARGESKAEGRRQKAEGKRMNLFSPPLSVSPAPSLPISSFNWLLVFWIGAYLLCSLNINKDYRYVLPYLPVVSLFLAYGITRWQGRWGKQIRWGTIGLAVVLMLLNLFPIWGIAGSNIIQAISPNAQHYAYLGSAWPHAQVIEEIIHAAPYVNSTLGVLPSTPEINQHNLNYYGALRDFQVYGRQVGTQKKQIFPDARSLDWFLTKTGNQGSVPAAQAEIVQLIEHSSEFSVQKTWDLPDGSNLKLYHRLQPRVRVTPLVSRISQGVEQGRLGAQGQGREASQEAAVGANSSLPRKESGGRINLLRVTVPSQVPPGKPVPVTYEWSGAWEQLQPGLVLLTWSNQASSNPHHRWLHDHGVGMGTLAGEQRSLLKQGELGGKYATQWLQNPKSKISSPLASYLVIEQMAMLPPADLPAGIYSLEATYLNRKTGETYPISVPPVTLKIDPAVAPIPAPELDLLTQVRALAATLPQGTKALERVFAEVGRINQYDPIQDYLVQMQLAMEYRLQKEPQNLKWAYALALSNVLRQQVQGAIAAFERVTQLDSQNPYAYAYLAFVHLYNWNGTAAQAALQPALTLKPNLPELQALNGIAALMQGNLAKAWHDLSEFRRKEIAS